MRPIFSPIPGDTSRARPLCGADFPRGSFWGLEAAGTWFLCSGLCTHTGKMSPGDGPVGRGLSEGGSGEHLEDVGPRDAQSCCCLLTFLWGML